jgi:hypothetical protein
MSPARDQGQHGLCPKTGLRGYDGRRGARWAALAAVRLGLPLQEIWRCARCGLWHHGEEAPPDVEIVYATFRGRCRR